MTIAYYNEINPDAAQYLRNLIEAGHIAPGYVDERSIEDVYPSDLHGFTQCHFFAGIGVWSHALRSSGWPDNRPVWTGSCPCQPFSTAGKGGGFADERHLWPAFYHLIQKCKPPTVLGEQVASKAVAPWIDLVHADMEALGYAFGCVAFPSAGVGAPHIRDRAYWVANHNSDGCQQGRERREAMGHGQAIGANCCAGIMGNTGGTRLAQRECVTGVFGGATGGNQGQATERTSVHLGGMDNTISHRRGARRHDDAEHDGQQFDAAGNTSQRTGPTNGFWRDVDWLGCRDGKWRPVEPGTFPLAHGASARVVCLRAYGNAINAKAAQAFIETVMDAA